MATLVSALVTRLQNRLGIDTASTLESARMLEAINAAVSKVASDGMPGATLSFSALVRGSTDLTVDTHTANTSSLTVTDVIAGEGIFPGDWFIDSAGVKHTIYSVVESTKTLGLGSPAETAITGTITVYRRSLELPHDGPVLKVINDSDNNELVHSTGIRTQWSFESGSPAFWAQHYSEGQEKSYITLAPTPSSGGDNFVIEQSRFRSRLGTGDNLDLSETVLSSIVTEAMRIHVEWSTPSMSEAAVLDRQAKDHMDGVQNASGGPKFHRRF